MTKHPIFYKIIEVLKEKDIQYKYIEHPPTFTSEESAKARGEPLSSGGKALLMKVNKDFKLFVLPADRKIDSLSVRKAFSTRKLRFASREELERLSGGLVSGSVPPFGQPILPFEMFLDEKILTNRVIAFNAASLTDSIILPRDEYLKIAGQKGSFSFSKV